MRRAVLQPDAFPKNSYRGNKQRVEEKDEYTTASHANTSEPRERTARTDRSRFLGLPRRARRVGRRYQKGDRHSSQEGTSGGRQEGAAPGERRARRPLYSRRRKNRRDRRSELRIGLRRAHGSFSATLPRRSDAHRGDRSALFAARRSDARDA